MVYSKQVEVESLDAEIPGIGLSSEQRSLWWKIISIFFTGNEKGTVRGVGDDFFSPVLRSIHLAKRQDGRLRKAFNNTC